MAIPATEAAQNFAIAPGGAPAGSIDVINDNDPSGPRRSWLSASGSTGRQDYNLDGAICIRDLIVGHSPEAERVQAGIREFVGAAKLDGKPTIIVHGRNDDRVPVSFSSRPYVGLNSLEDGARSQLRYIEVTNAEHFGTNLPGFRHSHGASDALEREALGNYLQTAMSPDQVAAQVIEAIRHNWFYVFTHREYSPVIHKRMTAIGAALTQTEPNSTPDDPAKLGTLGWRSYDVLAGSS